MTAHHNGGERELSDYDQMTDQQLCETLRADTEHTPAIGMDTQRVLYVMELLAKKRSHKKGIRRLRLGTIIAASVLAVVIGGAVTAAALGLNAFEFLETFRFGSEQQSEPSLPSEVDSKELPYAALQKLLDEHDVPVAVPTWLPEGYELLDVKLRETPKQRYFNSAHICNDQMIKIQIKDYLSEYPEQIQQSGPLTELYVSRGVQYYIFPDNTQLRAAWVENGYECYISGELTLEEMKKMIDSMNGRY